MSAIAIPEQKAMCQDVVTVARILILLCWPVRLCLEERKGPTGATWRSA